GKTIAYFSDASGEYELILTPQNGKGEAKKIKLTGSGFYRNLIWAPDSKKVSFSDNAEAIYWLDVDTGKQTKVAEAKYGRGRGLKNSSWSHDAKWMTYAIDNSAKISQVFVYSLEQNKSFPVTDGLSESSEPVFDASGKYLYFLNSTDTGMSKHAFMQSAADSQRPPFSLNPGVLGKEAPSPFLAESDEEKGESGKPASGDRPAGAPSSSEKPEDKDPTKPAAGPKKEKEPVKIDLAGI